MAVQKKTSEQSRGNQAVTGSDRGEAGGG